MASHVEMEPSKLTAVGVRHEQDEKDDEDGYFPADIGIVPRLEAKHKGPQRGPSSQRWVTFVRNHAQAILACDFFLTVTASFRLLYVFVIMELGSRRIAHFNVTAHSTSDWTLQQFREVITGEKSYRFLIHDRDSIYSSELDSAVKSMSLSILKTPFRAPQANAFCERLVGSMRRECLDFLIPLSERHLREFSRSG
jgi:transposase InsO family protein